MQQDRTAWTRLVFRLRGIPNTIDTFKGVADFVHEKLDDASPDSIQVFSLATTLNFRESPLTKVATIMFQSTPSIVRSNPSVQEWHLFARSPDVELILDTHFMGMTPFHDVEASRHCYEYVVSC
jgi:hypothetical protein